MNGPEKFSAKVRPWPVAVVFEGEEERRRVISFSNRLAGLCARHTAPDVSWWQLEALAGDRIAKAALESAARADLVIVSLARGTDLPEHFRQWIESWLKWRGKREGSFVGLVEVDPVSCAAPSFREVFLRQTALRAGMDYFSNAPLCLTRDMAESPDGVSERVDGKTSVLDGILRTRPAARIH
jgi:uncharacterized membrane protein YwzB